MYDRRSIRLRDFDYSAEGAYFVTICTYERIRVLGDVVDGEIALTSIGEIAHKFWLEIPDHFPNVCLDEWVVMPNHVHGIIIIHGGLDERNVGVQNFEPLQTSRHQFQHILPRSVGSIVRAYKSAVTRWCRTNGFNSPVWQRNYYEHVVRDEDSLNKIREYILTNPLRWQFDKENLHNVGADDFDKWLESFKNRPDRK